MVFVFLSLLPQSLPPSIPLSPFLFASLSKLFLPQHTLLASCLPPSLSHSLTLSLSHSLSLRYWQWYWKGEGTDQRRREVVVIVGEEEGEQAVVRVPDAERQRHHGRRLPVEEVQRPPQVRRSVSRSIS